MLVDKFGTISTRVMTAKALCALAVGMLLTVNLIGCGNTGDIDWSSVVLLTPKKEQQSLSVNESGTSTNSRSFRARAAGVFPGDWKEVFDVVTEIVEFVDKHRATATYAHEYEASVVNYGINPLSLVWSELPAQWTREKYVTRAGVWIAKVDYRVMWYFNATSDGHGPYIGQAAATLDYMYCELDAVCKVTAKFSSPRNASHGGVALRVDFNLEINSFFGVASHYTDTVILRGDGTFQELASSEMVEGSPQNNSQAVV